MATRDAEHIPPNPSGLCQCGCGQVTSWSLHDRPGQGLRRGDFHRFVVGHGGRHMKLTDEQIRSIRRLSERLPKSAIAAELGIPVHTVRAVCVRTYGAEVE